MCYRDRCAHNVNALSYLYFCFILKNGGLDGLASGRLETGHAWCALGVVRVDDTKRDVSLF